MVSRRGPEPGTLPTPSRLPTLREESCVVVATHTQTQQRLEKEVPFLAKATGLPHGAALPLGGNYLCRRKLVYLEDLDKLPPAWKGL